jgi:chaperonin cofactor prefoldin
MSEKRVVSRNVAIALGIIVVIVLAGLVGAAANYTSIINDKDSQIRTLTNQKNQLQTWLNGNKTALSQISKILNQTREWLDGNLTYYKSLVNSKDSEIANLQNQISNLNSQVNSLNAQIINLQNQINSLKAPKLIPIDLRAEDNRPWLRTPYLHVHGYVCNVGTNTAYNSKIHVVAYQSGGVEAINTYINLGTMYGESWKSVDANIYYSGSALTSWTLRLEWTS